VFRELVKHIFVAGMVRQNVKVDVKISNVGSNHTHWISFFVIIVLQWGGALHPFISFCFKNYSDKVFKLVGVCAINRTSNNNNNDRLTAFDPGQPG